MAENEKMEQNTSAASAKAAKAKKDKKSGKPGMFARIGRWFHELRIELKKVVWPTRQQTVNKTLVVIASVFVVGVFIWIFDAIAGGLIQALIHLVQG